ncbi:MAG: hypothetical protein FWF42_03650 [Streptococcaceae bacterium]|nr:hypothetical protein [Streptococcaceae bacterium]MCL2858766.1 hypothetical protein [Streptococcaceae bacterium]
MEYYECLDCGEKAEGEGLNDACEFCGSTNIILESTDDDQTNASSNRPPSNLEKDCGLISAILILAPIIFFTWLIFTIFNL